jgi:hypothetical protein
MQPARPRLRTTLGSAPREEHIGVKHMALMRITIVISMKQEKQSEGQYSFDDYDDNVYQEPES